MTIKYNLNSSVKRKNKLAIKYKEELNEQQFRAVSNINGPQLVIAGAGSGKTRTLIYRAAYLVEHGISPESILLLTFTRKSASEMLRRASGILDGRCLKISGGTFHSFANTTLRKYGNNIGYNENFTIVDRGDSEDIINIIRTNFGLNKKDRRFPRKGTILNIISKSVNTGDSYKNIILKDYPQFAQEEEDILKIYEEYTNYKFSNSIMDYDDLLVNLNKLLGEHAEIRQMLSNISQYIMVDEYQDTNPIQASISLHLASAHKNIMVVGDDSQSIYSFRGANFKNIMDFPKLYPNCMVTTLEENYRSTQPILNLTNSIIESAQEKYSKKLFSNIAGSDKPAYIKAFDANEQAEFVCQKIMEIREVGTELHHIAVLFRAGWHSNELEVELKSRNIPFVKHGGRKFVESAHIKDVMALMRVIFNPHDAIGWHRFLLLIQGIGPKSAESIIREVIAEGFKGLTSFSKKKYGEELGKLYKTIDDIVSAELPPAGQLQSVLKYYAPILKREYDDYKKRIQDLNSLVRISERYSTTEKFLTDIALEPPENSVMGKNKSKEKERLVLSTIHSAKGLEWRHVFIIHMAEGYIPSSRALSSDKDIEEERRLFYVAATRAKEALYLITPEVSKDVNDYYNNAGSLMLETSRFIEEIEDFDELSERWSLE